MTAIYGTCQEWTELEDYYPDYPSDNFTYIFSTKTSSIPKSTPIKDNPYSKVLSCEINDNKDAKEYKNTYLGFPNYFYNNVGQTEMFEGETVNKPCMETILNTIRNTPKISKFTTWITSNKYFKQMLSINTNLTLLAPTNDHFDKLLEFIDKEISTKYRKEYISARLTDIMKSYIIPVTIYPEQLKDRAYRISTMLESNNWTVKDETFYNQFGDINSNIIDFIQATNGIVYVIDYPLFPNILGVSNNNI